MKYSWHDDVYKKALKNIGLFAEPYGFVRERLSEHIYLEQSFFKTPSLFPADIQSGVDLFGWMKWFEEQHPDIYKKFLAIETRLDALWNQTGEKAMSEFKELCKQLEDAHRWAIREFVKGKGI